ncbi:uncharacterized protein A4U43_C01F23670 [Asparagus officinalis]|uniref:BHLH domain-containing protein n=1 Tax=Asparagus officinalis TaxID=4686 RepID=A0A5P1FSF4_ASPOF|nr:uncharacterized protein A4U43_C01F23670 [Asparagus officinalis]
MCTDGWLNEDGSRSLFDLYRASFSSVESGVPGLAYKEGIPYIELAGSDLNNLASSQIQRQFYQEAGVKISMQLIQQLLNEDVNLSQIPADQNHPSSSSSSLRSLSAVSSPEYSSLLPVPTISYTHRRNAQFPTAATDEAAIMRAMLTVISSSAPSSSCSSSSSWTRPVGAFRPYDHGLIIGQNYGEPRPGMGGHRMIKTCIAVLRRMNLMSAEARMQGSRPPTSNQLHHMISERKRREKLNESFHALRMLLPPGAKKDKASVLFNTRDYLNNLKLQVSEMEERNRMLESQLTREDEIEEDNGASNERVDVQIARALESSSLVQRVALRITVRVECDMADLLLRALECLKEMGGLTLVSVNANTFSQQMGVFARLNISLQVEASDWDEQAFKEAVTRAVTDLITTRPEAGNR